MDLFFSDDDLATYLKKRRKWSPKEEKTLLEQIELRPNMPVPSRKFCEELLNNERDIFAGRCKADIQDKYRRMIKKIS